MTAAPEAAGHAGGPGSGIHAAGDHAAGVHGPQAAVFRALGDPHRLRALHFLATAEPSCCASGEGVCACDLVAHLGLSQPTVSHHMRVLVACGLVQARKCGRWTHYALCPAGLEAARAALNGLLREPVAGPAANPAGPR